MIQIYPSILATTEIEYQEKVELINNSPSFEGSRIHLDLMDNAFVKNQSIHPETISKFPINHELEAHFMVQEPADWLKKLPTNLLKSAIAHLEIEPAKLQDFIKLATLSNIEIGLAINLETPIENLKPFMSTIQRVLIMSIHPGHSGQEFIPEALDRIKELSSAYPTIQIGVDGGVSLENIKQIKNAGATYVVMASHLLEGDIDENLEKIWEVLA